MIKPNLHPCRRVGLGNEYFVETQVASGKNEMRRVTWSNVDLQNNREGLGQNDEL